MTARDLNEQFGIGGEIEFREHGDLVYAHIATPLAQADIYLQGAHLTAWQPHGEQDVIYLSPASAFTAGKAIRGGIPILFPSFGNGWDGKRTPAHGFARTSEWSLTSTGIADGDACLCLALAPNVAARQAGYSSFDATLSFRIGRALELELAVTNTGAEEMVFEDGFHSYFAVGDVERVTLEGLGGAPYLDKRDNGIRKIQQEPLLAIRRDTDRVYPDTASALTIHDAAWQRRILIEKTGSNTTVVWNPWSTLTPDFKDLAPGSWQHFLCVEPTNAGENRITLAPAAAHRLRTRIAVLPEA